MTTVKSVPSVSRFASWNSCDNRTAAIAVGTSALTAPVGIAPDATPVLANVALSRDEGRIELWRGLAVNRPVAKRLQRIAPGRSQPRARGAGAEVDTSMDRRGDEERVVL